MQPTVIFVKTSFVVPKSKNRPPRCYTRGGVTRRILGILKYWMEVEVHVFGFSIAANVLLSFFPFLIVMVSLFRSFGLTSAEDAIFYSLGDFFSDDLVKHVKMSLSWVVPKKVTFRFWPIFLLLFTANGVFEPLEVALNKVWGVKKNRSFLKNQVVSLGLIFACGSLALLSVSLTHMNREFMRGAAGDGIAVQWMTLALFKMLALPVSICSIFLIYWLLPNRRIHPLQVLPESIVVGLVLEVFKYLNLQFWPVLRHKLILEYSTSFHYSAAIILYSFLASMIILAGGAWAAHSPDPEAIIESSSKPEVR